MTEIIKDVTITHSRVTEIYYSIEFECSNKSMPKKISDFFDGIDFEKYESMGDAWNGSHEVLRDYEGDYQGIYIYYDARLDQIYDHISNKLEIDSLKGINIKISC